MNRKNYLAKNTALFALNSIGTKLIIFILVPVYTKALETRDFGVADLVTTLSSIVVPIITLNIHESVMRFSLDKEANHGSIQSIGITVIFFSIVIGLLIIPLSSFWSLLKPFAFYFYMYCVTQGVFNVCISVLRGTEMFVSYAICNIVVTLTGAILNILFLVHWHLGIKGYFLGFILSYVIGSIYSVISTGMYRNLKNYSIDLNLAKKMSVYSLVLIPNSLMWWIMNASDRLMVISMVGLAANGIYAVSYKIPSAISTMSVIFNQAWSYSAIHEEDSKDKNSFNERMYNYLFEFQILVTAFLLLVIKPLMKIYVAQSYYSAWRYTPPLLFGYFFMSLGTFFSTQYTVKKDSKGFLFSGIVGASVNIVLNLLLIPKLGPLGASVATAMAYISVFAYRVRDTKKYFDIKWISANKIVSVIIMMIMCMFNYVEVSYNWIVLIILFISEIVLSRRMIVFVLRSMIVFFHNRFR